MKIIKPQRLALLTRTFEDDGQSYCVITAMAFVPFAAPRELLHEATLWKASADQIGRDGILDMAMSKRRGEVLVAGRACSVGGKPTAATSVRVEIGSVKKELYVVGDRQWVTTGHTAPTPFMEMPITWERAYGGEGFARNPGGRGHKPVLVDGRKIHALPNVESPKHLIGAPGDHPEPVGFGPLDPSWPQRMALAGTYDAEWLKTRFPGVAKDFDWEYHNVAPIDQRIQGYFEGTESVRVEGMHPDKRVQETSLPGLRARLFLVGEGEGEARVMREASARLDTVYLFPTIERVALIYRGMLPVAEDDARDVKHVIAAFEAPEDKRSADYYLAALERRLDKKRAAVAMLSDADLMPSWEVGGAPAAENDENDMERLTRREDLRHAFVMRGVDKQIDAARKRYVELGLDPAELDKKLAARGDLPPKDPAALPAYLERMEAEVATVREEAKRSNEEALARAREQCKELGLDFDRLVEQRKGEGGGPPGFSADRELERLRDLSTLGHNAGADVRELDAKLEDPTFEAQLRRAEKAQLDAYRRFTHYFPAAGAIEGEADRKRERVIDWLALGENLQGRDLTGANLTGLDFEGADLSEVMLEGADLTGAVLARTNLEGATLARAKLERARLEGARLVRTNFGLADLRQANLGGADLTGAIFYQADLRGASLAQATITGASLLEAKLAGVDLSHARAPKAILLEVDLSDVVLRGAELEEAVFHKCVLDRADLGGANLQKTSFVECRGVEMKAVAANLEGARVALGTAFERGDFRGVKMKQTLLRGGIYTESDFSGATAPDCDFSEGDFTGCKLYRLDAPRSLFVRTNLSNVDLRSANLMYAVLQKAKLHGADLRGCNLFRADLAKVRGDKATNFKDAYLVQIRVVPEKNQQKLIP